MLVYLVRHGAAIAKGAPGGSKDSLRPLAPAGIAEMRRAAAGLATIAAAEVVFSSPYLRARQTAEIVRDALKPAPRLEPSNLLLPESPPSKLLDLLSGSRVSSAVAVGHEPQMGELASLMIAGNTGIKFGFTKGAACCIEFSSVPVAGAGELRWYMTADILGRLAQGK